MTKSIPAAIEVQAALQRLTNLGLQALAQISGVPYTTLWKVRSGDTANPGIETVRKFMPHVNRARKAN